MTVHLLVRLGRERFAFALDRVLEALDAPALHDPPHRPEGMLGTLHHRGQTLSVWDGARAFGVRRVDHAGTALVLADDGRRVALLVDDAEDIVDIAATEVQPAPRGTDGAGMLTGVVQRGGGLVSVVRVEALVSRLKALGVGEPA